MDNIKYIDLNDETGERDLWEQSQMNTNLIVLSFE